MSSVSDKSLEFALNGRGLTSIQGNKFNDKCPQAIFLLMQYHPRN